MTSPQEKAVARGVDEPARPPRFWIPLLALNLGAVVLLAVFLNGTLGEWGGDNVDYLLLAEAIATGEGYYDIHLGSIPAHTHYPPLYPLLLAPWVGLGAPMILLKAWTALFSVLGLNAVFFYLVPSHGRRAAFLVAAATLCCGAFLDSGFTVMSEGPYFLFSILALLLVRRAFAATRKGWAFAVASGLMIGVAVLTRTVGVAMGPAVAVLALLARPEGLPLGRRLRQLLLVGLCSFLVVGSWVFVFAPHGKKAAEKTYTLQFDASVEKEGLAERPLLNIVDFTRRLATTPLPEALRVFGRAGKMTVLGIFLGLCGLSTALVVVGFLQGLVARRNIHDYYVFFYLAILLLWIPGGFRLVMPILPFLFGYAYEGLELLAGWISRLRRPAAPALPRPSRAATAAMVALIAVNLLITLQFPLIRDRLAGKFKPWWREYLQAVCELGAQAPPGTVVVSLPETIPYYLTGMKNIRVPHKARNPERLKEVFMTSPAEYLITTPFQMSRVAEAFPALLKQAPENFVEIARYGKTRVFKIVRPGQPPPVLPPGPPGPRIDLGNRGGASTPALSPRCREFLE